MKNDLTPEELELAIRLGLIKASKEKSKEKKEERTKVLRCHTTCKLCRSKFVQYLRLREVSKGSWIKDEEIEESQIKENETVENCEAFVQTCGNCKRVLMEKEKEDLVEMILRLKEFASAKLELWSYMRSLRKEEEDDI